MDTEERKGPKQGDRVGAFTSVDWKSIYFLGWGTYQGEEIPAYMDTFTFEEAEKAALEAFGDNLPENMNTLEKRRARFEEMRASPLYTFPRIKPKIVLDNGEVVWGHECHFGPEAEIRKIVADKPIVQQVVISRKENGEPTGEQLAGNA